MTCDGCGMGFTYVEYQVLEICNSCQNTYGRCLLCNSGIHNVGLASFTPWTFCYECKEESLVTQKWDGGLLIRAF